MLATLRAELGQPSVLLSVYDQAGTLQIGLALGPLGDPFLPLPKHINLTDGRWADGGAVGSRSTPGGCSELDPHPTLLSSRWHRLALSVDGAAVTLVSDCVPQLPVLSPGRRLISTAGLTVLGTQNPREKAFEVWGTEGHLSQPESKDLVIGHKAGLSSGGVDRMGGL